MSTGVQGTNDFVYDPNQYLDQRFIWPIFFYHDTQKQY